ncbi:hypothetical protein EHS13_34895 [Paenibacillus psychroresistens]|uniref:Beta-galactosidase trimerisation domain-containing protein n=1 Tax=Paenibacillus psychroresistens TaxID=1778678 RepID=A0A6B8RV06_9BACL|nr:hypothetical protein [Paenibacillus psychroresistens]QGQ99682.1 hypothetical protein EHS13_34895 [Paenibacillus psychroresistens]
MKLSFHIIVPRYEDEQQFKQLLSFLLEHKDCVDEIAFFTDYWHHGYFPLEDFSKRCEILEDRMVRLREHGFTNVGINVLDTLGHLPEAWDWLPKLPYQAAMSPDGVLSKSSFCPNSNEYRAYIATKYTLVAKAKPAIIWVEDDIRMHSLGVPFACFCAECVRIYNHNHQTALTREQLVSELNSLDGGIARTRWVEQNVRTIERLLELIEESVHTVDSRIELGLMTLALGLTTYAGSDFKRWFKALKAVKARPGNGFYDDNQPFDFVKKIHEVNRQVAHYPDFVQDIQYELENFPFQRLKKSIHITMLECTVSIMSGVNGIAVDALKQEEGELEEYHALMRGFSKNIPLWTAMDEIAGKYKNAGLYPALSASFEAKRSVVNGKWFENPAGESGLNAYVLSEIGIPLTMDGSSACATILTGNLPEGYTTDELIIMLSGGVLLDGRALQILTEKGLGAYCGVSIEQIYDNGIYERLTDDPLNGEHQGEERDARTAVFNGLGYILKPLHEEVRILSRLISYTKVDLGPTTSIYENTLGGRVAVQGYAPWDNIHSEVKRTQIMQICDWLSYGRLPVIIDSCIKVVPFLKQSPDESSWLLMLMNASFDDTEAFVAKLRYSENKGPVFELLADGSSIELPDSVYRISAEEIHISIDNINGWRSRFFYQR